MKEKIFPVKTKTGCPLKWNWSTIFFQSGTTSSCHRTEKLQIPKDDFGSFHNLPKKIEDRERMLQGKWPKNTCDYCSDVEEIGGYSDRMNQISQLTDKDNVPPELWHDKTSTRITPTNIEVYFRNTCNMSCVYCGPHFSSKWEEENKKYGPIAESQRENNEYHVQTIQNNEYYDKNKQDFFDHLRSENRYKILRWFSFLGGEPLVIPELEECLDFWDQNPNDKLTFQVITNLKATDYRFDKFVQRIRSMTDHKKVLQFKVICSLDCLGSEAEYVRYGIDLKQWTRNFEKLLDLPQVEVGINSAISLLTLHKFPQLLEQIDEWNNKRPLNRKIVLSFNMDTHLTDPRIAGGDVFANTLDLCSEKMKVRSVRDISVKKYWEGLAESIRKSKPNAFKLDRLKRYLSEVDRRRNTDWKKTFPWLADLNQ
jgi:organic radical activating enzyme